MSFPQRKAAPWWHGAEAPVEGVAGDRVLGSPVLLARISDRSLATARSATTSLGTSRGESERLAVVSLLGAVVKVKGGDLIAHSSDVDFPGKDVRAALLIDQEEV